MPIIPVQVLKKQFVVEDLYLAKRGKTCDTYLMHAHPDKMLVVHTDRVNFSDFVLNAIVEKKGEYQNAMSYYWMEKVIKSVCKTDFIATGAEIDKFLPPRLRNDSKLQKTSCIVKRIKPSEIEDSVHFVLTGPEFKCYKETGLVHGCKLNKNLHDGSLLPKPIYVPTKKAECGYDGYLDKDFVIKKYGKQREEFAIDIARLISRELGKDIILANIKFEFGIDEENDLVLSYEKATPDSICFLDIDTWFKSIGKTSLPPSMDKQFIHDWCKMMLINEFDPNDEESIIYVHDLKTPADILKKTTDKYLNDFKNITGTCLEDFQIKVMGIK